MKPFLAFLLTCAAVAGGEAEFPVVRNIYVNLSAHSL